MVAQLLGHARLWRVLGGWGQKVTVLEWLSDHASLQAWGGGSCLFYSWLSPLCPQQRLALGGCPQKGTPEQRSAEWIQSVDLGNKRRHKGGKGSHFPTPSIRMGPLQPLSELSHRREVHEPAFPALHDPHPGQALSSSTWTGSRADSPASLLPPGPHVRSLHTSWVYCEDLGEIVSLCPSPAQNPAETTQPWIKGLRSCGSCHLSVPISSHLPHCSLSSSLCCSMKTLTLLLPQALCPCCPLCLHISPPLPGAMCPTTLVSQVHSQMFPRASSLTTQCENTALSQMLPLFIFVPKCNILCNLPIHSVSCLTHDHKEQQLCPVPCSESLTHATGPWT